MQAAATSARTSARTVFREDTRTTSKKLEIPILRQSLRSSCSTLTARGGIPPADSRTIEMSPRTPMRTGSLAIVLTLIASSLLCAQQDGQTQEQVFRSALKAVAVYVTVSDSQGRLVPDLTKDDFEVFDNG